VPYATVEDMQLALGEKVLRVIGDFTGDLAVDQPNIERALEEATALADSYIDGPITGAASAALRRAVIDIAAFHLRSGRDKQTESSRAAYNAAVEWLKAISAGKASLGGAEPETPAVSLDPGDAETEGLERIWSRESSRGVF
jgi:phage gp36-like protein